MELNRRLWLNADGEVVEDGDPSAAFLLGNEGSEVPEAEAERLGLRAKKAANKQVAEPANKARKAAEDK